MIAQPRRAARLRRVGFWTLGWVGLAIAMLIWQLVAVVDHSPLIPTFTATVVALWHLLTS